MTSIFQGDATFGIEPQSNAPDGTQAVTSLFTDTRPFTATRFFTGPSSTTTSLFTGLFTFTGTRTFLESSPLTDSPPTQTSVPTAATTSDLSLLPSNVVLGSTSLASTFAGAAQPTDTSATSSTGSGLDSRIIAGIVAGTIGLVACGCIILLWICHRRRRLPVTKDEAIAESLSPFMGGIDVDIVVGEGSAASREQGRRPGHSVSSSMNSATMVKVKPQGHAQGASIEQEQPAGLYVRSEKQQRPEEQVRLHEVMQRLEMIEAAIRPGQWQQEAQGWSPVAEISARDSENDEKEDQPPSYASNTGTLIAT